MDVYHVNSKTNVLNRISEHNIKRNIYNSENKSFTQYPFSLVNTY